MILLFVITATTFGQGGDRKFKKFKGEVSFGYARFSQDADIKNGFAISLEPKFQVLDQLAIGGRIESVLLGQNIKNLYSSNEDFKLKAYQSFIATGEFYFTKEYRLRPFAGAGAGLYSIIATSTDYYYADEQGGDRQFKFGGMLRAGVEIKHLRIGLEYNFIPNTTNSYYDNSNGQTYTVDNKNAYFAVKVGFCFSGGPLNRD